MIIGPPHHITCVTTAIWKFMYVHIRTKITSLQVSHSVSPMETLAHGWIWWYPCPYIHTCTRVQLTTELTYSAAHRGEIHDTCNHEKSIFPICIRNVCICIENFKVKHVCFLSFRRNQLVREIPAKLEIVTKHIHLHPCPRECDARPMADRR